MIVQIKIAGAIRLILRTALCISLLYIRILLYIVQIQLHGYVGAFGQKLCNACFSNMVAHNYNVREDTLIFLHQPLFLCESDLFIRAFVNVDKPSDEYHGLAHAQQ